MMTYHRQVPWSVSIKETGEKISTAFSSSSWRECIFCDSQSPYRTIGHGGVRQKIMGDGIQQEKQWKVVYFISTTWMDCWHDDGSLGWWRWGLATWVAFISVQLVRVHVTSFVGLFLLWAVWKVATCHANQTASFSPVASIMLPSQVVSSSNAL